MLTRSSLAVIVRAETGGGGHDHPGNRTPRTLNVLRGGPIVACTTTTTAATAAGAHSAAPDVPGLFHPQHTALLILAYLPITPLFSTNADASTVAWIQHAALTAPFDATKHRKQRTCWVVRYLPASAIRKAARGRLPAAAAGAADASPGERTASTPFAARGT